MSHMALGVFRDDLLKGKAWLVALGQQKLNQLGEFLAASKGPK